MEAILHLDGAALLWIQENLRNDFLTPIVTFITHLGDHGYLWIALLLVLLVIPKTRRAGLIGAATLLLTFLLNNQVLKVLVGRTRPYEVIEGLTILIKKPGEFSFPSGHTANSMCVGVCLWMISRKCQALGDKKLYFPKAAGWFFLILSILIGLSRLYVGVHYPTDVLGGAVLAIFDAVLVFGIYKKILEKKK
jgi:undecaprenyl-diphosphatase